MGYILVIYDDADDLENVRLFLSFCGYKVEAYSNWEEARSLFNRELDCEFLITKGKMREINGNDIALYIRNSQKSETPIVAIGSTGDDIDPGLFNSVLMTPLKLKVLEQRVASFVAPMKWR